MAETLITDRRSASAHYKILRKLGKGGMAEVFLARQEGMAGLRRLTVVKKLLPQLSQVEDIAEMLLDEARIAAQLTHPNIVQIYELGKDEGQYFIAMEFVDGCDLATLARIERHRHGRIPLRLTLRVLAEAAMGLDYAHRQAGLDGRPLNIVHRDVSPHNLLCSREGAVKVTDFGIAKAVGKAQVTQVGVVKGKVQYMAPEQYTGGAVDHRSDIYSLGVILYQLTVGRLPRVTDSGEVVMRRVIEGKIPRPSELRSDYPDELEAIVMRALAHNPEERFPDAAALRDDLLDFARDNDLLAFPKELGEYVNAMVPSAPLVVRERSVMHVPAEPSAARSAAPKGPRILEDGQVEVGPLASVIVEGEEEDTDAPQGTEVASPQGKRKGSQLVVSDLRSHRQVDPTALGGPDTDVGAPMLDDEQPTPALARQDRSSALAADPPRGKPAVSMRQILKPVEAVERSLEPADPSPAGSSEPAELPTTGEVAAATPTPTRRTERTRPPRATSFATWIAVLASLVTASAVVYLIARRGPEPAQPPKEGSQHVEPGAGVLSVLSNPSLAAVSVDGAQRCPSTPCQIAGLPLGRELVLTLRAPGHTLWMQRLVLTASEPKLLLRADLAPEATPPPVRPDAAAKSKVEPPEKKKGEKKLPSKHDPEAKKVAGKGPAAKSQGKIATVPLEPGNTAALLAVDVRPWAEVWVDGQKVGHTPLQRELKPGARVVELKNPELNFKKRYRIKAIAGKKVKISEVLQPPPGAP